MLISIIIPLYNEEKFVSECTDRLLECMNKTEYAYEILLVNDGSTDCTASVADSIAKGKPDLIRSVGYPVNRGKGSAVRTGMLAARGDIRIFTDCDLAYGTEILPRIIDFFVKSGSDIVIGSRSIDKDGYSGYTFLRKVMSKAYIRLLSLMTGFSHSDSQTGLKAFGGTAAAEIFSRCKTDGFAFDLEALLIADKLGFSVSEMPVRIIANRESDSKINPLRDAFRMLSDVRKMKKRIKNL